jgi:hypothetical protein
VGTVRFDPVAGAVIKFIAGDPKGDGSARGLNGARDTLVTIVGA